MKSFSLHHARFDGNIVGQQKTTKRCNAVQQILEQPILQTLHKGHALLKTTKRQTVLELAMEHGFDALEYRPFLYEYGAIQHQVPITFVVEETQGIVFVPNSSGG